MKKRIHFVRHGETDNPEGIVYGLRDFPLTPLGRKQASYAGEALSKMVDPVRTPIFSSPVGRAMETATLVADSLPRDHRVINPLVDLQESVSMFDGGKVPDFVKSPKNWKRLRSPNKPSWGEAYGDVYERMWTAFTRAAMMPSDDVVMVSHQLPIWVLRSAVEGLPWAHDPASRLCSHASITSFTVEGGKVSKINYWHNPIH